MRKLVLVAKYLSWAVTVMLLAVNVAMAQDALKVAPKNYKVLLENQRVRVLDLHIRPSEKIPMHSQLASVNYYLSGCRIKATLPNGKTTELDRTEGETLFSEAGMHAAENVGHTDVHVLIVELKGRP